MWSVVALIALLLALVGGTIYVVKLVYRSRREVAEMATEAAIEASRQKVEQKYEELADSIENYNRLLSGVGMVADIQFIPDGWADPGTDREVADTDNVRRSSSSVPPGSDTIH